MPLLETAHDETPDEFDVLAVTYDDLRADALRFTTDSASPIRRCSTPTARSATRYGVHGIPQTWFIDADGVVQDRVFGITTKRALDEPLRRICSTRVDAARPRRHSSQRNQRAASTGAAIAHATSTTSSPDGNGCAVSTARTVSESAAAGSSLATASSAAGQLVERVRHAAEEQAARGTARWRRRGSPPRAACRPSACRCPRTRSCRAAAARARRSRRRGRPNRAPRRRRRRARTGRPRATSTVVVLATSNPPRDSGVEPSRFSTP